MIYLSLVGEVVGPLLHQGASALEQIGPGISLLGGVAQDVGVLAISKWDTWLAIDGNLAIRSISPIVA